MRFEIFYALFATVAVALPRGGNHKNHQEVDIPVASSMLMSSSMSMPMKRATPTSMATPSPSMSTPSPSMAVTSPTRGDKRPDQMKSEKMMMLF